MGYCMDMVKAVFTIKAKNVPKALKAVQELEGKEGQLNAGGGMWRDGQRVSHYFSFVDPGFSKCTTFSAIMDAWRWEVKEDPETGDVIDICFAGEKLGDDGLLFKTIAPFVESERYLTMQGEDGLSWQWYFDGGNLIEYEGMVTYKPSTVAPAVEPVRRVQYSPGNATRYDCVLVDLDESNCMLTWLRQGNGGSAFVFDKKGMVASSYMMEKMQIRVADAAALLVLIHRETGVSVMLPSEFNAQGLWDDTCSEVTLRGKE